MMKTYLDEAADTLDGFELPSSHGGGRRGRALGGILDTSLNKRGAGNG